MPSKQLLFSPRYVVSLHTSDGSALLEMAGRHGQAGEQTRLADRGITLSEKTCGILMFESGKKEEIESRTPEVRIVGQMLHTEAKRVNFDSGDDTGFEMTVSGIKPESLHRFEVRARCATLGLDAPDWRKKEVHQTATPLSFRV